MRRKETVLRYIFRNKRLLKRKNRGSTHLWLIFKWTLKEETKQNYEKPISGKEKKKNVSILFCRKKNKKKQGNVFKTVLIWEGVGRDEYFCTVQFFL